MSKHARTIVEEVLTVGRVRSLWTANYLSVLPFTPQDFEVGSVLPAMLYMARRGHRRGKGNFAECFGGSEGGKPKPPTLSDVARGLLSNCPDCYEGFDGSSGVEILADLLLTYCLENRKHALGHDEPVQRVFPTHYLASWLDLPTAVANLRGVPELLTALLAWQERGEFIEPGGRGRFPVGTDFSSNPLLGMFARHMSIRGRFASDLAADDFLEEQANDLGVDELLAVRLAKALGSAPLKAKGKDEVEGIPNRWPIADGAAKTLRRDLATFVQVYGQVIPRQAFLPMLEAGVGVGLANILLTTTACLFEWQRTGKVPHGQSPWPLFVDGSHGQDTRLRGISEAATGDAIARYERLPVMMMLLRVLDDRVRYDRKLKDAAPVGGRGAGPDARAWLDLLGEVYQEQHERASSILDSLEEDCLRLAHALEDAEESLEVARVLRESRANPAFKMAEALVALMGDELQRRQFMRTLESALMSDRPNGLAIKRRVLRVEAGAKRATDVRAIVLSNPLLDFLVHRHLRKEGAGKAERPLSLRDFLGILRKDYGLYVDREAPGLSVPQELLAANKAWLEGRLRDLGLLIGVNDAESMKQLQARFHAPEEARGDEHDVV